MQLLKNHGHSLHINEIIPLFENCEEAYFASAFLNLSGLNKILPIIKKHVKAHKIIKMIVGQNFALTEPDALYELNRIFCSSENALLHLAHAKNTNQIFHPKLFAFQSGSYVTIITGSANITSGGLSSNIECSLLVKVQLNDQLWIDTKQFFNQLLSFEISEKASLLSISQYENFYDTQKAHNQSSKAIPKRTKIQLNFNYHNLLKYFDDFDNEKRLIKLNERIQEYKNARKILDKISSEERLKKSEFKLYIDELVGGHPKHKRYWHSNGLSRLKAGKLGKPGIYDQYKEFKKLIQFVKDNHQSKISNVFDGAKQLLNMIDGAGINYLTEILMTYNPDRYANLNRLK